VAIQHLRELDFIGLTEKFEDSLDILQYFLQVKTSHHQRVIEKNDGKSFHITKELEEAILERTQLDLLLFEEASRLFDIQFQQLGPYLPKHNHSRKSSG